jgi:hypothetical protein
VNAGVLAAVSVARPAWAHLAQGLVLCRLAELVIGIAAAELVLRDRHDRRYLVKTLACLVFTLLVSPLLDLLGMWTSWEAMVFLGGVFLTGAILVAPRPRPLRLCGWLSWAAAILTYWRVGQIEAV